MTNGPALDNEDNLLTIYTIDNLRDDIRYAEGTDDLEIDIPTDVLDQLKSSLSDAVQQVIGDFIDNVGQHYTS